MPAPPPRSMLAMLLLASQARGAQFGTRNHTEYRPGTLPLVLSVPHGGYLQPDDIPDRTEGTLLRDAQTQEIADLIAAGFASRYGRSPHVVISHLHRAKVDPNREIGEGAQGNADAEQAWTDYHAFVDAAKAAVGTGLLVDVHGQAHEEQWVELGYLITGNQLTDSTVEEMDARADRSSLRNLVATGSAPLSELVWGATSLGTALAEAGYTTVPSGPTKGPDGGSYFSGGYITRRHGSVDEGTVDALQLEMPSSIRTTSDQTRQAFVDVLVPALADFLSVHYGVSFAADDDDDDDGGDAGDDDDDDDGGDAGNSTPASSNNQTGAAGRASLAAWLVAGALALAL